MRDVEATLQCHAVAGIQIQMDGVQKPIDIFLHFSVFVFLNITLPETNIAAENRPSQKEIHLPTIHF